MVLKDNKKNMQNNNKELSKSIIKEFEEKFGGGDESGDYPSNAMKSFLLQSCKQVAEDMLKVTELEKDNGISPDTGAPQYLPFNKGYTVGYNEAIDEIQQKCREWINKNFLEQKTIDGAERAVKEFPEVFKRLKDL